ncbi:MAG: dethiobiotin synthase [Thiohalophilus sp.]|uniref:dethiobiotin synthase n=1 Tax=Thiohalophilus sp. TaxID=3028392 RepID=UPI002870A2FC|nr:dethiobiotin synthase [Thiohalophilus sp.]MDR9435468.1 dethiobiotin synthase [Thiohalophilus sp.]
MTQYPGVFVTGTDTEIGKTFCSCLLMEALQQKGLKVAGMKPVASGGELRDGRLVNEDALQLQQQSGMNLSYEWVNPYVFEPPIAPHLAASQAGCRIERQPIVDAYTQLQEHSDQVIVEGVGGWRVPLSDSLSVSDLPGLLGLPVVLVVGMRLGCLNHALLTIESIKQQNIPVVGWIANGIDPAFAAQQGNLQTLESRLPVPCLAQIPHQHTPLYPEQQAQLATNIYISWL